MKPNNRPNFADHTRPFHYHRKYQVPEFEDVSEETAELNAKHSIWMLTGIDRPPEQNEGAWTAVITLATLAALVGLLYWMGR